ncbi:MAG: TlpA family protein disulfide reductase [Saprospiraceae bacterium]|nr:TlpA family protein disulfide reductase [Saprospiraceae bacterium]
MPDFTYATVKGKKTGLSDLKGKVVYIDVWATWCGPCLRELPALERLEERFKDDSNIAFVSVSVDADKTAWAKMVKDKNMGGIQLYAEGEWNSSIVTDYKINGIPRFIIIGKDGNIVNANASRPSSKEIVSELKDALKQ